VAGQVDLTERFGRFADRVDFGVSGWVARQPHCVVSGRYQLALSVGDRRPEGTLTGRNAPATDVDGRLHEFFRVQCRSP
jgi:hypothetical protein